MEKEMIYVAPAVEMVEVAVEKGFAGSPVTGDGDNIKPDFGDGEL